MSTNVFKFIFMSLICVCRKFCSSKPVTAPGIAPSGIVCVYKPKDVTSNGVVVKVRKILESGIRKNMANVSKVNIKVGHGGTLDPLAEGNYFLMFRKTSLITSS